MPSGEPPVSRQVGMEGERQAEESLKAKGLRVLERNYRSRCGEIDLIALDGETLVFVEVKARRESRFGLPQDAVGAMKRHRLVKAAQAYLLERCWDGPARFDVVAILDGKLEHIPDAFPAE